MYKVGVGGCRFVRSLGEESGGGEGERRVKTRFALLISTSGGRVMVSIGERCCCAGRACFSSFAATTEEPSSPPRLSFPYPFHSSFFSPPNLFRRQRLLHLGLQILGLRRARPPLNHLSIPPDQKLLKVPLDHLQPHQPRLLLLQPLEHGLGLGAVDVDLAQHGETHAVVELAEFLDLVVGPRVLAAELVAGEAEDGEVVWVLRRNVLVELLEPRELRGEAAFGGRVYDEDDFAFVGGEGVLFALFWEGGREVLVGRWGKEAGEGRRETYCLWA